MGGGRINEKKNGAGAVGREISGPLHRSRRVTFGVHERWFEKGGWCPRCALVERCSIRRGHQHRDAQHVHATRPLRPPRGKWARPPCSPPHVYISRLISSVLTLSLLIYESCVNPVSSTVFTPPLSRYCTFCMLAFNLTNFSGEYVRACDPTSRSSSPSTP